MIQSPDFLQRLIDFDKESISDEAMTKLQEIFDSHPDFNKDNVMKTSFASSCLFSWVHAMLNYKKVYVQIDPLRKQLIALENPQSENKTDEAKTDQKVDEETKKHEEILKEPLSEEEIHSEMKKLSNEIQTALCSLDIQDINELKALAKPAALVKLTMQCICILFCLGPKKLADV